MTERWTGEERRRFQKDIMKEAFKEAFRDEIRDIKMKFGGWTIKALGAALITAVAIGMLWFLLTVNGWHHFPERAQQRVEQSK